MLVVHAHAHVHAVHAPVAATVAGELLLRLLHLLSTLVLVHVGKGGVAHAVRARAVIAVGVVHGVLRIARIAHVTHVVVAVDAIGRLVETGVVGAHVRLHRGGHLAWLHR